MIDYILMAVYITVVVSTLGLFTMMIKLSKNKDK